MSKSISSISKWRIIWCSIGLGVLYWFTDCFTDVFIFKEGTLTSQIFSPYPHELWMRSFTMIVLVFLGILAQWIIKSNRKAEERIKDVSSQWRTTFDAIEDSIFIADAEGRILRCNKAFANFINKQESEIIGHTCHEVVHGTADFIDGCPFITTKDTRQREVKELEAGNKWFSVIVDPVLNDSGAIIGYVHFMSDITERKHISEVLKESEERYRLLFHNSPIGVFHYDVRLHITECNNRFVDILRSSREKLIGLDMETLNDKSVLPAIHKAIEGNEGFYEGLYKATTSQAEIWVSMRTAPIFDSDGKVKGGVGIVEDITIRTQAELALKESEEKYKSVIENVGVGISVISPDMEILSLNSHMRKWFPDIDTSKKPICYKAFNNPPKENLCSYCPTCKTLIDGETHESITDTPVGNEIRNYRVISSPIKNAEGKVIAAIEMVDDITESRRAGEKLRTSEERFRSLAENIDQVFWFTELNPERVLYVSPAFERIWGVPAEELYGNPRLWVDSMHMDDRKQVQEAFEAFINSSGVTPYKVEYRIKRRDEEIRWIYDRGTFISSKEGQPHRISGVAEDITERKQGQEAFQKTIQTLQSLFQASPVAILVLNAAGEVTMWSPAAEHIFGWKAEEVLGRFNPIVPDEKKDEFKSFCERILSGESFAGIVVKRLRKDGSYIDALLSTSPVYDQNGSVTGIMGILTDITQQKKAEEALHKSEENLKLYQTLINQSNDSIEVLDPETGSFFKVNNKACTDLGYSREELLSMKVFDIDPMVKPSDFQKIMENLRRTGGSIWNGVHLRKDGSTFPVEVSLKLVQLDRSYLVAVARDITERKRAEEDLRKRDELMQQAVRVSEIGVFDHDQRTDAIYWSPQQRTIHGWGSDEPVTLQDFLNLIHSDDRESISASVRRAHDPAGDGIWDVEHRIIRRDGSVRWLKERSQTFFEGEGNTRRAVRTVGAVLDITERKKMEESLNERIRLLSFVADVGTALISTGDLKDILKNCAEALVGHLDAAFGRIWTLNERDNVLELQASAGMYTHIDGPHGRVPVGKFKIGLIAEERKPHLTNSVIGDPRIGDPAWAKKEGMVAFAGYPLMIDNRLVGVIAMFARHDLTEAALEAMKSVSDQIAMYIERKKLEGWIFQIKQDWEDTFNIITDMITVHDEDFNIIRYNRAAEKILGLSFLNIKKEKCYQFYHGTECAPAGCPSCMTFKTGVPSTVELFEPHLNMFIEIRAIPRFDSEHNLIGLIHVVRDITEHRKLENQLRQSQKMEAVGQLAGGIAHDFNNILTGIIGYASIMKMKAGQDASLRVLIDNVLSASEKAANLVQSLLAFSRKQVSNPEPVKINEIIKSIEKLLSIAVGDDIELKIELTEDLIVIADIVQIEQVMMNLCTNARDAMLGTGTLTIKTEAVELTNDFIRAHGYGEEGRYALISVSDSGIGMDENTRERIFEPFFTTKEVGKGTGLGLSIAYGIIKQHKGYIICQSEPGKGTTFNIYLPVIKAAIKEIKSIEPSESAGAARTILFAEDEEEFRKLMRQILESSGYNVIEAVDGADAVNKFTENNNIDLLLFDIIMPKISGKEAYEKIRKIRPDVKALFISGYPADFTDKYGVFEEGMNFISKPVQPAALLRKIMEVLGNEAGK